MLIIGVAGRARHGKNTVGAAMAEEYRKMGFLVEVVAFADRVKELAVELVVSSGLVQYDDALRAIEQKPPWMRSLLQAIGQNFREIDRTFWIRQALDFATPADVVVVTDVRYQNEAESIRVRGGKIVKVRRVVKETDRITGEQSRMSYYAPDTDPMHPSEAEADSITGDATIESESGMLEYIREMARENARGWSA